MAADAETVVVVGSSSATMTADVAEIGVTLSSVAETVGEALSAVAGTSRRVFAAAGEHGIGEADWLTERVTTGSRMESGTGRTLDYTAEHGLRLRLGTVTTAPAVLDAVSRAAGDALRLGGLSLTAPDATELRSRLAVEAVGDARERAQRLADAAGAGLGPVRSIVEEGATDPAPRAAVGMVWMEEQSMSVPLQAGADRITVRVFVTFALEPAATAAAE